MTFPDQINPDFLPRKILRIVFIYVQISNCVVVFFKKNIFSIVFCIFALIKLLSVFKMKSILLQIGERSRGLTVTC